MRRRDLIPLLLERPHTPSQLAQAIGSKPSELVDDVAHLLRSLRHRPYTAEVTPAVCRRCGFEFATVRFSKPSRCPQCRATWIAEPELLLRQKPEPGDAR
jgi:predicted Zn-ribbon and HTH transcriptional regulator